MATEYELKKSLPNKMVNENNTITDLAGNPVSNAVIEYENKQALPNKWLNPDGTYSTLAEILSDMIDTDLFIVVEELPASGNVNKIYLLTDGDKLTEYHWTGTKWDPIGMVEFDISKYSTTEQMNATIAAALNSAKAYTDAKLAEAKSYADGLGSNYDPAGSASSAETAAKAYADTKKSEAISSSNGYTDTAIQTSITQVLGGSY